MPFVAFRQLCPEIAARETRVAAVSPINHFGLPADEYSFHEMFCDEPDCDCRRVFFTVVSAKHQQPEAVIAWGWEEAAFYARWYGEIDLDAIREMQGPGLNLSSHQSKNAEGLLRLCATVLLADPAYRERIKRHYALFRGKLAAGATKAASK